ncbi:hypothetical protein [Gordonia sp. (in: high G+C Gram-positive bacteria)]|uniref:hypothetical protein n=1 Tax=Gordonia sp. (in: high G+C Gram-positive bacteria) TaxID=84139 RepID=UPI0039E2843B
MKRIKLDGLGSDHNTLATMIERLQADGLAHIADLYVGRQKDEEEVFILLRDLGSQFSPLLPGLTVNPRANMLRGVEVANWLIAHGWQPPEVLACRLVEADKDAQ